jgi:hypothetical protein
MQSIPLSFSDAIHVSGRLLIHAWVEKPENAVVLGLDYLELPGARDARKLLKSFEKQGYVFDRPVRGKLIRGFRRNAFVNQGLNNLLDRAAAIGGAGWTHIMLSSDNTAVTASTTTMGGTISAKAISPATTRSNQTTTSGASWTQADSPGPATFSVRKIGISIGATDVAGNIQDIIGGAGVSPYNKPFTIDFQTVGNFTAVLQVQVTAAAV